MKARVAVAGARGYVGIELLRLLGFHPAIDLVLVLSRSLAGRGVDEYLARTYRAPPVAGAGPLGALGAALSFEDHEPDVAARAEADAWILALPNDVSPAWVEAITAARPKAAIVDLSTDHRFDDTWVYGLPELGRDRLSGARRVANPGCYATAAALALAPIARDLAAPPAIFGVSGYSGAGTAPSARNDPERLRDNLVPYAPVGHAHEREIARHLGGPVRFMPHVAPFFRGITLTISLELRIRMTAVQLEERYRALYAREPLVRVGLEVPLVRDIAGRDDVAIGGFACDGEHAVVVATVDNLLKGAATQAVQNLNLALRLPELLGLRT